MLYFEATGRPWDLSNPALTLKLDFSHTSSGWSSHSQPVILLCNPAGTQYIRLVHNPTTAYLMATASGSVSTTIQPAYAGVIPTDEPAGMDAGSYMAQAGLSRAVAPQWSKEDMFVV